MAFPDRRSPRGFAAPFAIVMLIAIALLALLILEAALGELRTGAAVAAEARATTTAESMLADVLSRKFDTLAFTRPPGTMLLEERSTGTDSILARVQLIGGRLARIIVTVRMSSRGIRVFAGREAFVSLVSNPLVAAEVALAPLVGNWWAATP